MRKAIAILATCVLSVCSAAVHSAESGPLRVCMISGSWEYDSETSLRAFEEYLESNYNVEATLVQAPERGDLPGLEALDNCDVALFFTRRLEIDGAQLQKIKDYCLSGRPIVACRTASHGFQNWLEYDRLVQGGNYQGHFGNDITAEIRIAAQAADHPVLKGITPFRSLASLYKNKPIAEDCTLLMTGETPKSGGAQPVAWTREFKGARVFYTSLGAPCDFDHAQFRRMMVNALFWAAEKDVEKAEESMGERAGLAIRPASDGLPTRPTSSRRLQLRKRVKTDSGEWKVETEQADIAFDKTAFILIDVWNRHWCRGANERLAPMLPRMNELLVAARAKGALIIHAPSGTMAAYEDTIQRRRAKEAPYAKPPLPVDSWQNLAPEIEGQLPIDDSDGGCDCEPQCQSYSAWSAQHPAIGIDPADAISDKGQEIFNLLEQHGIERVFILGVHTNMCILGRPFGIRQMARLKRNPVLVRDLTDTMYNHRMPPRVPHQQGTELVVEHIEKHWCPTITSDELLEALK